MERVFAGGAVKTQAQGADSMRLSGDGESPSHREGEGIKITDWIETRLRHPAAGNPRFDGEKISLSDWQKQLLLKIYPPQVEAQKRARAKDILIIITGKKSGKTSLASWLLLAQVAGPFEPDFQRAAIIAPTELQSAILFSYCKSVAEAANLPFQPIKNGIKFAGDNRLIHLSGALDSKRGMQFSLLYADESCHLSNENSHITDTAAFNGAFQCYLGNPPSRHDHFMRPFLTDRSRRTLKFIKRCPTNLPYDSEKAWRIGNPSIQPDGHVPLSVFKAKVRQIKGLPSQQTSFRINWLSQWLYTDSNTRWFAPEQFIKPFPKRLPEGLVYSAAIDYSSSADLTALSLCAERDGKFYLRNWAWLPQAALMKRQSRNTKLAKFFMESGVVRVSKREIIDPKADVLPFLESLEKKGVEIDSEVGVDHSKSSIMPLESRYDFKTFLQSQRAFSAPCILFEREALAGNIYAGDRGGGDRLLFWAINNCRMADPDKPGQLRAIIKGKSAEATDSAVSSIMALALASKRAEEALDGVGLMRL